MKTKLLQKGKTVRSFFIMLMFVFAATGTMVGQGTNAGNNPGLPGSHGLTENQNADPLAITSQTFTLNAGWNWFSSYLECDANLLAALQAAIAQNNATALIKDMSNTTMLQNGEWSDSDLDFRNESMFMVNLSAPTTVTLTAPITKPADHPIILTSGWNWISFPLNHTMTLTEAFSSFTPNNGDMIKNMSVASTYSDGGWNGSLDQLEPGVGYMYYNNGATVTLTY